MKKQLDNIDSETTLQLKENKESAQTLSERSKNYVQSARVTSTKDKVNSAEFVPLNVVGYQKSVLRRCLVWIFTILTIGFLQLVLYWRPDWRLKLTHVKCALSCAEYVFITDEYGVKFVCPVQYHIFTDKENVESSKTVYFFYKKIKYIFVEKLDTFLPLRGFPDNTTCAELYKHAKGLKNSKAQQQKQLFGPNVIIVPVRPIWWLIVHEALNPFYIFQLYSCIVWFAQWYLSYTTIIIVMSVMSICITVYETRKQSRKLRDQVKTSADVKVYRDQEWKILPSAELVPGDVIEIPPSGVIDCDAVLLDGLVVMNESMLTGENVPETKTPLPDDEIVYAESLHKKHTLLCGTSVIHSNGVNGKGSRALVLSTGFSTTKGQLVQSILYPKPVDRKLYSDGMKFCLVSVCLGIVVVIYSVYTFARTDGTSLFEVVINAMDIITFVVPASLPAMLTIGTIYAQNRLEKSGIYCLSSPYINQSGILDIICFDKTGTLTADELTLCEIVPSFSGRFGITVNSARDLKQSHLVTAMATCQSLVKVDNHFVGDSLDLALYEASHWELVEPTQKLISQMTYAYQSSWFMRPQGLDPSAESQNTYSVVHQYPFSSEFQRMGTVVQRSQGTNLFFFAKGAPEKIADLCVKTSVPENLHLILEQYTQQGFRVVALAYKELDESVGTQDWRKVARLEIESELTFLGLCVLRNTVKPNTIESLQILHAANVRTIMVTGDNLNTAVYVARECGMISMKDSVCRLVASNDETVSRVNVTRTPFKVNLLPSVIPNWKQPVEIENGDASGYKKMHCALDGKTFALLQQNASLLNEVVEQTTVFGRMLPDQKAELIETLQSLGYRVGMCGDGANDCAALKTADTGVSLCNTEASVAAPFTSKTQDISCMPLLMREGRCALTTSFSLFKSLFGACWVECIAILILSWISNDMSDFQYLYIDLLVIIAPTFFFGYIKPYKYLSPLNPPATLMSFEPITSLLAYIVIQTIFLAGVWTYMYAQPWLTEWTYDYFDVESYQNSTMFVALNISILFPSIIFFYGPPYQKRLHTNPLLCICLLVMLFFCLSILFPPGEFVVAAFSLVLAPSRLYYFVLAMLGVLDFFVCMFVESVLINRLFHTVLNKSANSTKSYRNRSKLFYENNSMQLTEDKTYLGGHIGD